MHQSRAVVVLACWLLFAYLVIINALAIFVVRHDKRVAQRGRRRARGDRIPERAFLMLAAMGGGVGGLVGFGFFRHKTRKARFMLPFMLATLLGGALAGAWAALLDC